ncbi:MAG TPA: twin-arginine translocase TatA/TatE family subunit [Vicinamibacteria bacterium]|nr:twin-arginine translocase TatA/TatE family subunit [Vicinamibacteria bacterium]
MFGTLGGPEVILILVVALIVFGPRRLPEIGKSMGKMLAEFRKASNDFKRTIEDELEAEKTKESSASISPPTTADSVPAATEVTAAEVTAPEAPAAVVPDASATPAPPTDASAASGGTLESEPHLERPAEPVVSRDGSADKS